MKIKFLKLVAVLRLGMLALAAALCVALPASAQNEAFAPGWTLRSEISTIRFQSVKNVTKVESSGFASFSGKIAPDGAAEIRVLLDSVDTKVDLRNVRMRFLFFETFLYPEAVITTTVTPEMIADLAVMKRKTITLPYTLDLHGVTKSFETEVTATLLGDDMVAIASTVPIPVAAEDFNLSAGIKKLEEAANVVIIPNGTISFDLTFARNGSAGAAPSPTATVIAPATAALEGEGNFDVAACKGRFEILSRSGNIYFGSGSARLDPKSTPLLDSIADIVTRCPGLQIEVAGHTDSDGSAAANERLSESRARAVTTYLSTKGIPQERFIAIGRGEAQPVMPNDTADGKARNRRIEFQVLNG